MTAPWITPDQVIAAPEMSSLSTPNATIVAQMASDLLNDLSGKQFGVQTVTVRPSGCGRHNDWLSGAGVVGWGMPLELSSWLGPTIGAGPAGGIAVQCGGCSRWSTGGIRLSGKVVWDVDHPITILVDGDTLDPSRWSIVDGRIIVRTDSQVFRACQDLRVATTEKGTLAVTYSRGVLVPTAGVEAAILLASELAKALEFVTGPCNLPQRVTNIVRQGVTVGVAIDPLTVISEGGTGLTTVDLFIAAVNPHKLRRRASIHTPGLEHQLPSVTAGTAGAFT